MNLSQLEARLRDLLEARLMHLLPATRLEARIVQALVDAIRQGALLRADGTAAAPSIFTFVVHPELAAELREPQVINAIRAAVHVAIEDAGMEVVSAPRLAVAVDESAPRQGLRVVASHEMESIEDTTAAPAEAAGTPGDGLSLQGAFFIIQGTRVFAVRESVTNIGRRLENHLVLDDPRVSRNHAQLRLIGQRFVIFDLGSSGGTLVNGNRITQSELRPGDVLSLAGVSLVFGQDTPPHDAEPGDTSPTPPAHGVGDQTVQVPGPQRSRGTQ